MTTSILQTFLRARLIDFHGDDTRLAKLHQAVEDVTRDLLEKPGLIPAYLVVALDSTVTDDPVFDQIAAKIELHWPTYGTAFPEAPATVFRAIALDALNKAQQEDVAIAQAVTLLARNLMPLSKLGVERVEVQGIVDAASAKADLAVEAAWTPPSDPSSLPTVSLPASAKIEKTDRKALQTKIEAASGPHNAASEAGPTPNPHWPNAGNPWSYEFAPRMTAVLADAVDAMADTVAKSRSKGDAAVITATSSFVNALNNWSTHINRSIERKVSLLWWRESLYSHAADTGYRSMDQALACAYMAVDLAKLLPAAYPRSVEYYLREAVLAVVGALDAEKTTSLVQLAQAVVLGDQSALLKAMDFGELSGGRQLVVQGIVKESGGAATATQSGLYLDARITLGDFAVWLLREAKALDVLRERGPFNGEQTNPAAAAPLVA